MLTPRPLAGPTQPIRLADVPLHIRRRVGWRLIDDAADNGDLALALALKNAVERPSPRVYWLPRRAVEKVLG